MLEKTYYSHSRRIYNTFAERSQRNWIEKHFGMVVCSNRDIEEMHDMKCRLEAVKTCHKVVCTEFDGYIGRDVHLEVREALKHKISVLVLRKEGIGGSYKFKTVISTEVADTSDWIHYAVVKVK